MILFWALLAVAIITASVNHFQLTKPKVIELSDSVASQALFVCPAADKSFDLLAKELTGMKKTLNIFYIALVLLWIANLGWTIYNSLLIDKFERSRFDFPIFLGKSLIFLFVIGTVFMNSPNHYRDVVVLGSDKSWVLCEKNSPNAQAVQSSALSAPRK